jgi:polysaccharide pyruvyl transferase WcaK-like protein
VTKIALFGVFANGNLGNDATLEAMLANLAIWSPGAEICCICPDPEALQGRYGIAAIPIDITPAVSSGLPGSHSLSGRVLRLGGRVRQEVALWGESATLLRGYDHLIFTGTGLLDDFGVRPWNLPYDLYKWATLARRAGARVSFVSVGAGPIVQRASRWLMLAALRQAHYRSYRDQQSKDYLAGIGFDTRTDQVYPDLVFSLPPARLAVYGPPLAPPRTVGVGVMGYYGWSNSPQSGEGIYAEYIAKLSRFCGWLLGQGYAVHLLTGEMPTDQRPRDEIMTQLRATLDAAALARLSAPAISTPDDVLAAVAATDLVVATRFHNVIAGLLLGRPVISAGYAKKNDVLLADMGLGDFCQHAETLDVERLQEQFTALAAAAGPAAEGVCRRVQDYRRQLNAQYAQLFAEQAA